MNFNSLFIPSAIYVVLLFTSCNNENEYRVEGEFEEYVVRFENEASERNLTLNLHNDGLIIEFADLKDNQAGLCHYENPIRIEIDRTYWQAISPTKGADYMKENLLFHELGHGILKRDHLNTTLENDDWKSIMCGGDKVDNRPWNINYRGLRRDYYVDELFNESTSVPDFSSMQLRVDTSGYIQQKYLSFDTEKNADSGWSMSDNVNYTISIDNKRLKFQSKIDYPYFIFTESSVDVLSDFSFQVEIQCQPLNTTDQYGIIFGLNNSSENIEYFSINNSQKMYTGNRLWYSYYTELTKSAIKSGENNKLFVLKKGTMLYYFINDVYVYCSEIEITESGKYFGFIVPSNGTVWLDNMSINVSNSSNSKQYINKKQTDLKFYIQQSNKDLRAVFNQ